MIVALAELAVILVLVVLNGILAASEFAIVSARKARLHQRARDGNAGARRALDLANFPNRFLSTVQIGITAVAVIAGAFGGARVAGTLAPLLVALGVPTAASGEVALLLVVGGILFLTLVVGELVPKRIALHDPERLAALVAGPMQRLATLAWPLVRLLGMATDLVLRMVPLAERAEPDITEEEIRGMIAHATETGVLEATEQQILERLFRLSDRTVDALMTPREAIVWIDRTAAPEDWRRQIGEAFYTRYVVADGDLDSHVGYVKSQDLLKQALAGPELDLDALLRTPHVLPGWTPVFRLFELFQWSGVHMALVTATGGRVEGVVTLNDVLKGIVGDIVESRQAFEPGMAQREDGSWLVDGLLPFDDFLAAFAPDAPEVPHHTTVHAFVMAHVPAPPQPTAAFHWRDLRLEIVDTDATRVDKVLVSRREAVAGKEGPPPA